MSEPEFLIHVMDRHPDWCKVVCLVGGGQEINTGEAGISEWITSLEARFPAWDVYLSPRILLPEYGAPEQLRRFFDSPRVCLQEHLHLAVSMRSFRAEALSEFVGHLLANRPAEARSVYESIRSTYPVFLTRSLGRARDWLRSRARGTERSGLVASSGAQRLRPEGIHVKAEIDPANWFLNPADDVRSCYALEDAASEFLVQGLELDWAGVCWDADFYHHNGTWRFQSFRGTRWQSIHHHSRRLFLMNAYRVLLTRARQGMILFVPAGDERDRTRLPCLYDGTCAYLRDCGIAELA
jgi:hypothetical protein